MFDILLYWDCPGVHKVLNPIYIQEYKERKNQEVDCVELPLLRTISLRSHHAILVTEHAKYFLCQNQRYPNWEHIPFPILVDCTFCDKRPIYSKWKQVNKGVLKVLCSENIAVFRTHPHNPQLSENSWVHKQWTALRQLKAFHKRTDSGNCVSGWNQGSSIQTKKYDFFCKPMLTNAT